MVSFGPAADKSCVALSTDTDWHGESWVTRKDDRSMSGPYPPAFGSSGLVILPEKVTMLWGVMRNAT